MPMGTRATVRMSAESESAAAPIVTFRESKKSTASVVTEPWPMKNNMRAIDIIQNTAVRSTSGADSPHSTASIPSARRSSCATTGVSPRSEGRLRMTSTATAWIARIASPLTRIVVFQSVASVSAL